MRNDIYFMEVALKEAKKAYKIGEVPVGCVLVDQNDKIIAKAYNKKEKLHDVCGQTCSFYNFQPAQVLIQGRQLLFL